MDGMTLLFFTNTDNKQRGHLLKKRGMALELSIHQVKYPVLQNP